MIEMDTAKASLKYYFEEITNCEMCGDDTANHKVIGKRLNQSQGLSPKKKTGISISVKKCSKCDLIYAQPMPIPFDIQDHYGVSPDEYWKDHYFEWSPSYFERQITVAKKILPFKEGMKALDIGAGIGKCMKSLSNAGFDAFGFEPSKPFYEMAISKMGIKSEKLQLGMVEEVEYPDNSFDFITFGAVLEHLYHPADNLAKAMRWLKPRGIIHVEVPSSHHLIATLIDTYYKVNGTNYTTHISPMHNPFHMYEFGLKSFMELGNNLGFKIEEHYYEVGAIMYVPNFLQSLFRKFMEVSNTGMQLTVYLRKE